MWKSVVQELKHTQSEKKQHGANSSPSDMQVKMSMTLEILCHSYIAITELMKIFKHLLNLNHVRILIVLVEIIVDILI